MLLSQNLKVESAFIWILLLLDLIPNHPTLAYKTTSRDTKIDYEESEEAEGSTEADEPPTEADELLTEAHDFAANETSVELPTFMQLLQEDKFATNETIHIREILSKDDTELFLICCPRRYGRAIDLDMIETFLQPDLSADGITIVPYQESRAYKIFIKGQYPNGTKLTDRVLEIAKEKHTIEKYMAQWPVINFRMNDVYLLGSPHLYDNLARVVRNLYKKYDYVKTMLRRIIENPPAGTTLTKSRAESFIKLMERYQNGNCTRNDYVHGVKCLSEIMSLCFRKKVFIFVNRFDRPFHEIYLDHKDKVEKKALMQHLQYFLKMTFKNNAFMKQGIMISIFPIPRRDLLGSMPKTEQFMMLGRLGYAKIIYRETDVLPWNRPRKNKPKKSTTQKTSTTRRRKSIRT